MKLRGAKGQTLFLTAINAVVRALGLVLRMVLSRMLGAELMGISELAQSIHMAAIAPLTSGIPIAVSRLTAKAPQSQKQGPLHAGIQIVRTASAIMIPALWILSPWIARMTGDERVLPSLWLTAPCVLVLGYSAVYNGYCYGMEQSVYPAISELIEQTARLIITLALISVFHHLTIPWIAALPVAATLLAEIIGLLFVCVHLPRSSEDGSGWRRQILQLSAPATFSRMIQTLLRSATAILIPLRLQSSGLSSAESTARLGMFNGMVMPILMLPCVFTSALSMVSIPKIAKAEEKPGELRRLLGLCMLALVPAAGISSVLIYLFAPFLSVRIYRLPELTNLFRSCAPMALLFAAGHMCGSVLSALGQQKRAMYTSCITSMLTLLLTWLWAGDPSLRLQGVIRAQVIGQFLSILSSGLILLIWRNERQIR